jgi:hypothetical protein
MYCTVEARAAVDRIRADDNISLLRKYDKAGLSILLARNTVKGNARKTTAMATEKSLFVYRLKTSLAKSNLPKTRPALTNAAPHAITEAQKPRIREQNSISGERMKKW